MKWKNGFSGELRSWILFVAGLGLAYGLYRKGTDPGPYWTLIIGVFVGAGVLVSSILSTISSITKGNRNGSNEKRVERTGETGMGPDKPDHRVRVRLGRLVSGSTTTAPN